ncbi:hypothetical protein [Parabacteroides sp. FAFU027]|uniref:hypothetical protein n=1 Tax=Parabacteroides sp. FAFU027 TaxID=2922715 RepID=UPI001FB042D7|nr:hypothetical protein [Parabacteroides sp. FAFU027]
MNKPIKVWMFYIAAVLVLISTALFITKWFYAPYLFAVGASGMAVYYLSSPYQGENTRLKRLHRYEVFTAILLVVTSYLMFKNQKGWIVTLSIGAFLQLYTTFVYSWEEKKEKESDK